MKYTIPTDLPLLEALALYFPQSSKTTFRSWIKEGRVFVDQEVVRTAQMVVKQGQTLSLSARKKYLDQQLQIMYEDSDIVVVDKPAGLLSVATAFEKGATVHAVLKKYYHPRPVFVVHRLDQDTSGVMLFALSDFAYQELKKTFANHDIKRQYIAIVEGQVKESKGTWRHYLMEDDQYTVHVTADHEQGQEAITHYKVGGRSKRYSWLYLQLETGRKNQIRVQCLAAGHPVIGDKKYGSETNPIKRLGLHAQLLSFAHPNTKKMMHFESPMPSEFSKIMK